MHHHSEFLTSGASVEVFLHWQGLAARVIYADLVCGSRDSEIQDSQTSPSIILNADELPLDSCLHSFFSVHNAPLINVCIGVLYVLNTVCV